MKFLLADSELELTSDFIKRNKLFIESKNDEILERGKHRFLLGTREAKRAGRPDIAYIFHSIFSNLTAQGIEYGIHTRNNKYIDWKELIGVETYEEFKDAIIPLLKSDKEVKLNELLFYHKKPLILSQFGSIKEPEYLRERDLIVIGGFPTGDYISEGLNFEKVSIDRNELTVPMVIIKISKIL